MPRARPSAWLLPAVGVVLGGLALAGLTVGEAPRWVRGLSGALVALAILAPALPPLVLLPWHFVAVRRGLTPRRSGPCAVRVVDGALFVDRGGRRTRLDLHEISRARRARNDNWTESKLLEDALGLFSSTGRELARVPLGADGIDALFGALAGRGVPIDDVLVSAPALLD